MIQPRVEALGVLPPALRAPHIARWGQVDWHWGLDETRVTLLEVEPTGDGVVLHRQVWFYDEYDRCWSLDDRLEVHLPEADAAYLVRALGSTATGRPQLRVARD